jgi:hypothetical protein
MQRFLNTGKDKTITIKIKCLKQNARNFTTFSDRKILMWRTHQLKKKIEKFRNKIFGKGIQHNEEAHCIENMCQQNPS